MDLKDVGILIAQIGGPEAIKRLVSTAIDTHIKPILQKHADYKDNSLYLEECLSEYLKNTYDNSMIMSTIVFRNINKTIYDLYIPLYLLKSDDQNNRIKYIVNEKYLEFVSKYNKILIVDTAGMGKSTLAKYLVIQTINNNDYIPILIELRRVNKSKEIIDYILDQFNLLDKKIDKNDLIEMLKSGKFLIIFDGYDEITNENKGDILDDLQKFIQLAKNNKYILTSRDDDDLNCLGDFQRFSIKPLSIEEAFSLIRKYDNNGLKSEKLIERIKSDSCLNVLKEFLVNPMLVSLLYKTFEYKEELPYKKLGFYSQVYDALFNDHDKTKGSAYVHPKKTKLDSLDFEKLLRKIAFISLINNQVEYNKQDLVEIINKSLKNMMWVSTSIEDVLDDLCNAVSLFQKDGNDYKWKHKSFMEYFSAGYICYDNNRTEELFDKIINSTNIHKYKNVIEFCYDMKPDIARRKWVYKCISDYTTFYETIYDVEVYNNYFKDLISARRSIAFSYEVFLIHIKSKSHMSKILDELLDKMKTRKVNNCLINGLTITHANDILNFGKTNKCYLVDLLFDKKIDVFKKIEIEKPKYASLKINYGEHYISDDINLILNKNKKYFEYVTHLLVTLMRSNYILDFEKCVKLKKEIEWEMNNMHDLESEYNLL
nr:NACHT domain-containing protein [uncultured Clostridium sp.]